MHVHGKCHCGAIAYEADVDPTTVRICHCTDCQALSGSAFRIVVPAEEASFRLRSGAPKAYIKTTADSGVPRLHAFCADCGSPVYVTAPSGEVRSFGLRVGTLRQRDSLVPKRQTWLQSKLPWLPSLPGVGVERQ